jgi:general secretion pathway protein K
MSCLGSKPQPLHGVLNGIREHPLMSINPAIPRLLSRAARHAHRGRESGIALILVLWLTVLLTVIGGSFAYGMRNEALAARNTVSLAQARALADGAIYRTVFELMRPRGLGDVWSADGIVHAWDEEGGHIVVNALDESGKIDLNTAPDALIKGLLQTAGGQDDDAAARLVDAIGDWKDVDDLRRPNGAEAPDYQAAGLTYKPGNAPFEAVAELQRVLGMNAAIYGAIADSLTVYSRMAGINPVFASRTVLLAVPGATPDIVDTYIAQRDAALAAKQPPPVFPVAGVAGGALNLWRIRAEVTTVDGVTFAREAVVRPGADRKRLLSILEWKEGDRRLLAASDKDSKDNADKANGTSTQ